MRLVSLLLLSTVVFGFLFITVEAKGNYVGYAIRAFEGNDTNLNDTLNATSNLTNNTVFQNNNTLKDDEDENETLDENELEDGIAEVVRNRKDLEERLREKIGDANGIGQEIRERIEERKEMWRNGNCSGGNCTGPMGQFLRVREIAEGLRELRSGNISAYTDLEVEFEEENETEIGDGNKTHVKVKIKVKMDNGEFKIVKIMPDTAADRALERLRLKVCSEENNCSIELKDTGEREGNSTKLRYEVQVERHSRILGIFQKKMQVRAEVDTENGEVVAIHKPWWAFIASEPSE